MFRKTRTADARPPIRYLALGDSFTIGTGIGRERAFPALLAARWRAQGRALELSEPAVNGYATDELIAEELPLARTFRPTLVTVLIGANDIVRAIRVRGAFDGPAEERYRVQLDRIHYGLRLAGVPASAVHAIPQPDWSSAPAAASFGAPDALRGAIERANAVAWRAAERAASPYVDLSALMRSHAERAMFAPDGLHPSADAHAEWAEALAARLGPA
ncbi:MAG: SGNH/GDSL hydrolase family protein [Candidatus Limnocylindria bacterium]